MGTKSSSNKNPSIPSPIINNFSNNPTSTWNDDDPIDISIQTTNLKEKSAINSEDYIKVEVKAMESQIQLKKESQILPVLVSLKTSVVEEAEENQNQFKPGIDIVCVIDTSGSMSGEKIKLVQQTLKYIIELLGENDRFSLIRFSGQGSRLSPLLKLTKGNKEYLQSVFKSIQATGGTDINSGMELALQTLKQRKCVNHVSSIFLLSDGQDNGADHSVQQSIQKFQIEDTFTIHTFGFGTDHDGKLMKSIANLKDGNFYYIETLDIVNECFVDALGGLISVIAQNVKLSCKLIKHPVFSDMRISKTYGNWKLDEDTSEYYLIINQLLGGVTKDNVFEINIPPIKKSLEDTEKNLEILQVKVEYMEINSMESKKQQETKLKIEFYNEEEKFEQLKPDKDVSIHYLRVKGAQAIEDANTLASQRKYPEAQKLLDDALKILLSNEYSSEPFLKVLADDIKSAKNACESSNYQNYGANMMEQKTNVHMFQRSAPMQSNQQACCMEQMDLYSNNIQMKMKTAVRSKKS